MEQKKQQEEFKINYTKLPEEHQKKLEERYQMLLNSSKLTTENKWEKSGLKKGVLIHQKSDSSGLNYIRGEGIIPAKTKTVWHLLFEDFDAYKDLDPLTDYLELLEAYDQQNYVTYLRTKSQMLASARDMITLTSYKETKDNGYLIVAYSIDHPKDPNKQKKNPVRMDIRFWGYILEKDETNPKYTKATFVTQMDVGGWIPKPIQNFVADEQALVIKNISDYILKHNLE